MPCMHICTYAMHVTYVMHVMYCVMFFLHPNIFWTIQSNQYYFNLLFCSPPCGWPLWIKTGIRRERPFLVNDGKERNQSIHQQVSPGRAIVFFCGEAMEGGVTICLFEQDAGWVAEPHTHGPYLRGSCCWCAKMLGAGCSAVSRLYQPSCQYITYSINNDMFVACHTVSLMENAF